MPPLSMLRSLPWEAWLAAAGFIAGVGSFLDEYYVGEGFRNTTRRWLGAFLQNLTSSPMIIKSTLASARAAALIAALYLIPSLLFVALYTIWRTGAHAIAITAGILMVLVLGGLLLYALTLIPGILWMLLGFVFLFMSLSLTLVKLLIWLVFKPAARPDRSPFKFATGMLGLWILMAKLALELMIK